MRKLASLLLAAILLAAAFPALAEDAGGGAFVFLDGTTWGDTVKDVKAVQGGENFQLLFELDDLKFYVYEDRDFGGITAELNYLFMNDRLIMITVGMPRPADAQKTMEDIREKLVGFFGEPNSEDYGKFVDAVAATGGRLDDGDAFQQATKFLWELPDGRTLVFAADIEGDIGVIFLDQNLGA